MSARETSVLLVEDDEATASALVDCLTEAGYRVEHASDGRKAIARLAGAPTLPDVILLDLRLPGMTGWQFRDLQLNYRRLATIPVIVISAEKNVGAHAQRLRAAGFLEKPFSFSRLLETIERCLPQSGFATAG